MTALLELAERCEAATAEQEAESIEEAWRLLHPSPRLTKGPQWEQWRAAFDVLENRLACDAFTDAALTLVPEGWDRQAAFWPSQGLARAWLWSDRDNHDAIGKTEALAICAAALRAKASEQPK